MTKTVLVGGASGFIGSYVASRLAEPGYRVRAMVVVLDHLVEHARRS